MTIEVTQQQIDDFYQLGYTKIENLLSSQEIKTLQQAIDTLEALGQQYNKSTLKNGVFYEVQSKTGKKGDEAIAAGVFRKITNPSKGSGAFLKLKNNKTIIQIIESFGINKPYCAVDQINFKVPLKGTGFPYHQDAAFIFGKARTDLDQFGGLNMVIALDHSNRENGAFTVIPKSHFVQKPTTQDVYDTSSMLEDYYEGKDKIVMEQNPGDAILFHPWLAHGSAANQSSLRRRLVALWYVGSF